MISGATSRTIEPRRASVGRVVKDVDVGTQALVERRAEILGGGTRLVAADAGDRRRVELGRAARAVADRHVVQLVAGVLQVHHGAGHDELDVVGVCGDGEGGS